MHLTKQQAVIVMRLGGKVTHKSFASDEWITMKGLDIQTERGRIRSGMMFWIDRQGGQWDSGYSIVRDEETAKELWAGLGDVPVNEEGELEEQYLGGYFEIGADREEIWQWFEEYFDLSVAEDLMFKK